MVNNVIIMVCKNDNCIYTYIYIYILLYFNYDLSSDMQIMRVDLI